MDNQCVLVLIRGRLLSWKPQGCAGNILSKLGGAGTARESNASSQLLLAGAVWRALAA